MGSGCTESRYPRNRPEDRLSDPRTLGWRTVETWGWSPQKPSGSTLLASEARLSSLKVDRQKDRFPFLRCAEN